MINTTDKLIFLKSGDELTEAIRESIADTIALMRDRLDTSLQPEQITSGKKTTSLAFIKYFANLPEGISLNESLIESWYRYILSPTTDLSVDEFNDVVGKTSLNDNRQWYKTLAKKLNAPIQIALLFLYYKKAVLLTYQFPRIRLDWLENSALEVPCYTENIRFIRSFDKYRKSNTTQFLATSKHKALEQLYGQGMKMLVASTWYRPEDIELQELSDWQAAQDHCVDSSSEMTISPLPLKNLVASFHEQYPKRFPVAPHDWDAASGNKALGQGSISKRLVSELHELLLSDNDPLQTARQIAESSRFADASFAESQIRQYDIPKIFDQLGFNIDDAYICWLDAQKHFMDVQCYESNKTPTTAIGRFNLYLFVYLPLWVVQNPDMKRLYPHKPAQIKAGVHMAKISNLPLMGRPMTYMEFHGACGIPESFGMVNPVRLFFDHLVHYGDTLEGCKGVKQPMHKRDLPRSKKYSGVQKNIFPKKLLTLFIRFLYGLETLQEHLAENPRATILAINAPANKDPKSLGRNVATERLGFVPTVFHEGKHLRINQVHTGFISFVSFKGKEFYFPGLLRHAIGMVETGLRGQAIQWMDADLYDHGVDRTEMDPLDLNSLWVNTDKVKSTGFWSLVSNRIVHLFDKQRAWRDDMIERGAIGLQSPVYYENNRTSKWGCFRTLFAKNLITGSPITDGDYAESWTALCFSFQLWLKEHNLDETRQVTYIPKAKARGKSYFKWDDWEAGIAETETKVLSPEEFYATKGIRADGDACPVSLRSRVSPHGARASFVSGMITVLPAEYIGKYLTGQKKQTVNYYTKETEDYPAEVRKTHRQALIAAYEGMPANDEDDGDSSPHVLKGILNNLKGSGDINKTIHEHGLISLTVNGESGVTKTGLEIIASDKAANIGEASTHLCPVNFECPKEIVKALKAPKRCSLCPYAIFPANLLPRISAERHALAETLTGIQEKLEFYADSENVTQSELEDLEDRLIVLGEDVIGWRIVEESLWCLIQQRREGLTEQGHLLAEPEIVTSYIERISVKPGSNEEFVRRLHEVTIFPVTETPEMKGKIEKARRLLIARDKGLLAALMEPSSASAATEVVALMRSAMETRDVDIDELLGLITMTQEQWDEQLLTGYKQPPLMLTGTES
ncbi:MAG: hypothetical protein K6L60_04385 [Oceanobacter sp.]